MAVGRETSQGEISTFANLLKTFLPDHSDLPLIGNTEELLQHVKESINENAHLGRKQAKGKDGRQISQSHLEHSSQLLVGINTIQRESEGQLPGNSQCNQIEQFAALIPINTPVQIVGKSHCNIDNQQAGLSYQNRPDQLAADILYNTPKHHEDNTQYSTANNKCDTGKQLANSSSYPQANDYDSDATIDVPNITESQESFLPEEDIHGIEYMTASPAFQNCSIDMKHYACFVCDETFQELTPYTIHMTCHYHKTGSIKCNECGEVLSNKAMFIAHRKLSMYEIWNNRAKVGIAPSADTEESGGEQSQCKVKRKDGDEDYICSVCGKNMYKYSSYLKHVRTHKDVLAITCAVCQESFRAPCLLRYHIDLQHSHVLPFQCRRCLRRFKLKCSLSTHLRFCDVDPSSLPYAEEMQFIDQLSQQRKYQGLEGETDGTSQYSCPICTLMFDSPEDLKGHMNYHDETKPFKCEQCGRGFRSRHVLRKHATVHETKHECRCEICGVQLLTLSGYNAHLRGHRNQENIQAKFFPDSAGEVKEESTAPETALQILERIKCPREKKSEQSQEGSTSQKRSTSKTAIRKKLKDYKCPICGMLFFSGGVKFQIHARKEHKDATFEKCKLCSKSFVGKDNLEKHVKLHNIFADSYSCDECGKTFRRKFAMQVHKKMHTFKKFVKCDICGQEFRFVSEVEKHKNKKHRYDKLVNIYKCSICGQRFPMLSHLSVHCYCHNQPGAKPFECDLCKMTYRTSVELKKHIFEMHEKLMKKLNDSSYTSDTEEPFHVFPDIVSDSDVVMVTPEEAATKKMKSVAKRNLKDKAASVKSKLKLVEQSKSNNKKGSSDSILAKDLIKKEVSDSEGENAQGEVASSDSEQTIINEEVAASDIEVKFVPADLAASDIEVKFVPADVALPSNVDAYNLATKQFYHQSKFLKRYTCEVCQKAFSSNSDLKTHRRTHSGETPFKCDFCERSFKQRGHRKLHIQVVHTKEMPYKCDQCDSAFPTRYRFQIHIKRHSGVREHQCAYCDKGFYTLGKLNEHMKKRHTEEWNLEQEEKDELNE